MSVAPREEGRPRRARVALWENRRYRTLVGYLALHLALIALGVIFLAPLAWMVVTSLKQAGTEFMYPPQWVPQPIEWSNYKAALVDNAPFATYVKNTVTIAVGVTVGDVLVASLTAYSFARLRWPGRNLLFAATLATLMLPGIVTVIPTFLLMRSLHWIDTFLPLIVPAWTGSGAIAGGGIGGAFSIFLFRQFFLTIPPELDEAARMDGAGPARIWWSIILPLSGPVLATVIIFDLLNSWNDFFTPLIYLNSETNFTLALGLGQYEIAHGGVYYNLEMAAATAMTLPVIVLFFVAQRYFMRGIVTTGLAAH